MFEYNDERHEYKIDGEIVLSVTQIIPDQQFYCTPEQLEAARVEGNDNHSLVKMYLDTGSTFDVPYLIDFEKWFKGNFELLGSLLAHEESLFSKKNNFAGTPDIICQNAIIDLKRTIGKLSYHALQFAGYSILSKEYKLANTKKWFLLWHDGKKFQMKNCYNPQAGGMFKSLLLKNRIEREYKKYTEVL